VSRGRVGTTWALRAGAAVASAGAAAIHFSTSGEHGDLFGAGFLATGAFQALWAVALLSRPSPRVLKAGIAGQVSIVATWFVAHSVGLPFGPGAGVAEASGLKDMTATALEVAAIGAAATLLLGGGLLAGRRVALAQPALGVAGAVALTVAAVATPHAHGPHSGHQDGGLAHGHGASNGHVGTGHGEGAAHAHGMAGDGRAHAGAHSVGHGAGGAHAAGPVHARGGPGHSGGGQAHTGGGRADHRGRSHGGGRHESRDGHGGGERHSDGGDHAGGEGHATGEAGHGDGSHAAPAPGAPRPAGIYWEPGGPTIGSAVILRSWEAADGHHGSHGACEPTAEQREATDRLYRETAAELRKYENNPGRALAEGFTYAVGPTDRIVHMVNLSRTKNRTILRAPEIESFLYSMTDRGLVPIGGMYIMPDIATPGPRFGGCMTEWHYHAGMSGRLTTLGTGERTAEMLHVWTYPGLEPYGHYGGRELSQLWAGWKSIPSVCWETQDASSNACAP